MIPRQIINQQEYGQLIQNATLLHQDRLGARVWCMQDQQILKLFYRRSGLSWDRIIPNSRRFLNNTQRLLQKGITVPNVNALYRIPHLKADAVSYPRIPGVSLRDYFIGRQKDESAMAGLGEWIGSIHQKGIYCKSLHLGNILLNAAGNFALIDIGKLRLFRQPLSIEKRAANLTKLAHEACDRELLLQQGPDTLLAAYAETTHMDKETQRRIKQPLLKLLNT